MLDALFIALIATSDPNTSNSLLKFKEKIEARVGNDIITTTDLEQERETLRTEFPALSTKELDQRAMDNRINRKVISQYLEKMQMPIGDREVDQRINSIRAANGIQTQDQFRILLEKQGLTFDRFRNQLKEQMESAQFIGLVRRQASRTIEEKDLKAFFQNNSERYKSTPEVELQECVVPVGSSEASAAAEAAEYAKSPKQFSNCLAKHAPKDAAASATPGLLGKFRRGMLRDDVEARVFSLKENEIAQFPTRGGFQLLKVVKIRNLGPQTFESVKDSIREALESDIIQKEYQRTLAELKASTFIKI